MGNIIWYVFFFPNSIVEEEEERPADRDVGMEAGSGHKNVLAYGAQGGFFFFLGRLGSMAY